MRSKVAGHGQEGRRSIDFSMIPFDEHFHLYGELLGIFGARAFIFVVIIFLGHTAIIVYTRSKIKSLLYSTATSPF